MRQVKVQGAIKFLPAKESEDYFATRPFESQVGAWASQQSTVVESRKSLDTAFEQELKKYKNKKVAKPEHWGGYVLLPSSFEFWHGREHRLHDRIRYTYSSMTEMLIQRLMP